MKRLEINYTSKYGNQLDMVEIELNILTGQCLFRRINNAKTLMTEIATRES